MQKKSAPDFSTEISETLVEEDCHPRESTVNFLKQFARAYSSLGIDEPVLNGFVLN